MVTGCDHGCWYCYARKMCMRFPKLFPNGFKPSFHLERLQEPWLYKKPSKIFACSISDLFALWTLQEWRDAVLKSIEGCPVDHIFQLLTKNPERILLNDIGELFLEKKVWVGCTVTQVSELPLIESIKKVEATVRFASFEPLLGLIDMRHLDYLNGLDWAIIGKLTGSRRVQLQPEWVYNLVDALAVAGVPVFMKNNLFPVIPKEHITQEFPK